MRSRQHVIGTAAAVGILVSAGPVQAGFVGSYAGNDCAGVFGTPPNCVIPEDFAPGIAETPLILKIDFNDNGAPTAYTFGKFLSIDGTEFSIAFTGDGIGTWTYTPGPDDPVITAFTVKGGPGFNLFTNDGDIIDVAWYTPTNPNNGRPYGLSHMAWFDNGDGNGVLPAPAPATLALFALGGLAVGMTRRRRITPTVQLPRDA